MGLYGMPIGLFPGSGVMVSEPVGMRHDVKFIVPNGGENDLSFDV